MYFFIKKKKKIYVFVSKSLHPFNLRTSYLLSLINKNHYKEIQECVQDIEVNNKEINSKLINLLKDDYLLNDYYSDYSNKITLSNFINTDSSFFTLIYHKFNSLTQLDTSNYNLKHQQQLNACYEDIEKCIENDMNNFSKIFENYRFRKIRRMYNKKKIIFYVTNKEVLFESIDELKLYLLILKIDKRKIFEDELKEKYFNAYNFGNTILKMQELISCPYKIEQLDYSLDFFTNSLRYIVDCYIDKIKNEVDKKTKVDNLSNYFYEIFKRKILNKK